MSLALQKLLQKSIRRNISALFVQRPASSGGDATNVLRSDFPPVDIPTVSVDQLVFSKFDKWPNHVAAECAITGRKYTFDELRVKSRNLSRHLRKKFKLQKGDVVAVLLPNCPELSIAVMGVVQGAAVVTPLNPMYTAEEISRQLKDSGAKIVVTLSLFWGLIQKAQQLAQRDMPTLIINTEPSPDALPEGAVSFAELLGTVDHPDAPPPLPDDLAFLPYSSGTTGLPKGVLLTHANMVSNICQTEDLGILKEATADHQDVIPAVLPKFHIYGLMASLLLGLKMGNKVVDLPMFTPDLYVQTLKRQRPNILYVAPPIVHFLTNHPMVTRDDLASICTVISGAAPLGAADEERFRQKASKNIDIVQGYGLTETSPIVAMSTKEMKRIGESGGSVGKIVVGTTAKIVDPRDSQCAPLGPNQNGELLVKGPQVMKGYYNRPEENEQAFTEDGWFRTGDMMYYAENKMLFVTDRLKELIKVKGFQVSPAELEEIIRHFPGVGEAGVVGVPHPTQGEAPLAFVVEKPNAKLNLDELNKYVNEKVAPFKQLRGGIQTVKEIPKNAAGKILRKELKLLYEKNKHK